MSGVKKITNLEELSKSLTLFFEVTKLAGVTLSDDDIKIDCCINHKVASLGKNKMAVYVFSFKGDCLKVGKAGPRSQARYISHHYNASSSQSNLSKSLLAHRHEPRFFSVPEDNPGAWIKQNVERVNFILDKSVGIPVLNLLESFLQCRLNPCFEGFKSQQSYR